MKKSNLWTWLIAFLLGCQNNSIDAASYDGEYPIWNSNVKSQKYIPKQIGGDFEIFFNNHLWNHWPLLKMKGVKFKVDNQTFVNISINAEQNDLPSDCLSNEHLAFQYLLNKREYFNDDFGKYPWTGFFVPNCDASKDDYILDENYRNWLKITKYDSLSNQMDGNFDMRFKVNRKSSTLPIYPNNIWMHGSFSTILELRK